MPTIKPKLTIEEVRQAFDKRGDKLLTNTYTGTKQHLLYRCGKCKGRCTVQYNNYSRGGGCKFCAAVKQMNPNGANLQKIVLRTQHYSMTEVCKIFAFDYDDFRNHVFDGTLPAGSRKIGAKLYYTQEDLKKIRSLVYLSNDNIPDLSKLLKLV